ncbi:MAG: 23S rRNA (uracil(1939)-C(5))-methyltransferase RlmD [Roseburia sp.]|nr:23S rRNA (uracil(1939)-C(5))-methyltransferase RlmD [Roseburia sp.]
MEYRKNDCVTVTIEDMGSSGEGIGKVEGFTFFIKDAVIGDVVEAKVMKAKKRYAYARLTRILTPSPRRTRPACAVHTQCGGCQIQALAYPSQLAFKYNRVRNNLIRIGGFSETLLDEILEPIVGMEHPYRYRNKAQFPFGRNKEGVTVTGFYAGRTHVIIPNTDCVLGVEENKEILERILLYMRESGAAPYHEEDGSGLVRHVLIRKGFSSGELMVCLIINGEGLPREDRLVETLRAVRGMTSISVNANTERTNVIMGARCRTLWGRDAITDTIHVRTLEEIDAGADALQRADAEGITFSVSPLSFYQVNPVQTEKLYSLALDYAGLTGEEIVWDLYCGIGTISLFMAKRAKHVYGVEVIEQAIDDARENARRNGIDNATFYVGRAEEALPRLCETEHIRADVICADPPRKGCDEACLATMVRLAPKRIVYVSCDSATLARDLKYLCDNGYRLERMRPVDMFPETVHVETVCLLSG